MSLSGGNGQHLCQAVLASALLRSKWVFFLLDALQVNEGVLYSVSEGWEVWVQPVLSFDSDACHRGLLQPPGRTVTSPVPAASSLSVPLLLQRLSLCPLPFTKTPPVERENAAHGHGRRWGHWEWNLTTMVAALDHMAGSSCRGEQRWASFPLILPHHYGPLGSPLCKGLGTHHKSSRSFHLFTQVKDTFFQEELGKWSSDERGRLGIKILSLSNYSSYQHWQIVFKLVAQWLSPSANSWSLAYHPCCFLILLHM